MNDFAVSGKAEEDSEEDNSLSISLPSESSQNSKLRAGILRIFDEAEELEEAKFDNVIFDEKHEFEKTEKTMTNKKSHSLAWSSLEDRVGSTTPHDLDSGIDGQSRSSSSKDKVWSKIHKQLNRRFGGSTGSLSSTSPTSESKAVISPTSEGNTGNFETKNVPVAISRKEFLWQAFKKQLRA
jgi:hypothetical protein